MTYHRIFSPPSSTHQTPLRSPPPATGTAPTVLDLDRRLQFTQRLAVLIRRIQAHQGVRAKEDHPHED